MLDQRFMDVDWLIDRLTDWQIARLIDWLIDTVIPLDAAGAASLVSVNG